MKLLKVFIKLYLLSVACLLESCKKGKGAICNDGSRSHSTGSGTCSWHGGIDHYLDPNEISIGNTIILVLVILVIGVVAIQIIKNKE
ncbi:MAG: hypothetical protein ACYDEC_16865 [Bacteroidia bacterium]